MKRYGRFLFNNRGLTLMEVLASLTITTLILGSAYGLFVSGINIYKRINGDIRLRDEADIIVANIMNEFYNDPISNIEACKDASNNPINNCIKIYNTETTKISVGNISNGVSITNKNELRNTKKLKILKVDGANIEILYQVKDASGNEIDDLTISPNPVVLNTSDINVGGSTIAADCKYIAGIYKDLANNNQAEVTTKCVNALIDISLSVDIDQPNSTTKPLVLNSQFGL